eukprot:scaffold217463_cov33-Cyclotella_meneghiniana.AAC.1
MGGKAAPDDLVSGCFVVVVDEPNGFGADALIGGKAAPDSFAVNVDVLASPVFVPMELNGVGA